MATQLFVPQTESISFGPWSISSTKSRILSSDGMERQTFESELSLPHVPDMIFANNILQILNSNGCGLEFKALDALKRVNTDKDLIQVANAKAWKEARSDCEHIDKIIHPFDWTFTTDYMGTLLGNIKIEETTKRIDIEKLKVRDKIMFYADIALFEDELHDCGCSTLNVKIRVMPSYFFVLVRFYMRVDDVIVRINDSRYFHEAGSDYILREFTSRESQISQLNLPYSVITEPNEVVEHLQVKLERFEKLSLHTMPSTEGEGDQKTVLSLKE